MNQSVYILFTKSRNYDDEDYADYIDVISIFNTQEDAVKYATKNSIEQYTHIECISIGEELIYKRKYHSCILCEFEKKDKKNKKD